MKMSLNLNNARYEITAVKPDQYPKNDIPEVTFVGRSNVGKSSLINAMLNRKNLARVAATPGKTRLINFYNIDDQLYFVDLPGYGFAKVSKSMKASWKDVIETYLSERKQLRKIFLLVDIRHSPTSDDILMHEWLKSMERSYVIVATKLDKVPRSKIKERISDIRSTLKLEEHIKIIPFSSETKQGRDELWEEIL
ncbi:MAG TPA: YihA family ribosome biogenesis GTP-binding protein [Clostridium sp.]|uniref:Probable GTP-binding protein EngB n=2 Tax=Acetivibrio mesophilus TaxID=2487273 RepID=A0A4Q0I6Z5_9FIRM|nr:ribosome biogenesis GTP-binding protein YihA/YsxC [Acetivibrio mesophilus]ODM25587.1 YihA family ribosome biogenesis GTP-binding protein [Clostridium sp. Bc-iso-3]RXE60173.1 YihA family ribosome biogenesis GTP-binding protein [Acetivibrio mesophilus]HHV29068.1 YihA family ribosome biogenesis GTP-binding protein [Clostridium sp.]